MQASSIEDDVNRDLLLYQSFENKGNRKYEWMR